MAVFCTHRFAGAWPITHELGSHRFGAAASWAYLRLYHTHVDSSPVVTGEYHWSSQDLFGDYYFYSSVHWDAASKVATTDNVIVLPSAVPLVLFLFYPIIVLALRLRTAYRRHCRRIAGLCWACGYNLRGSPGPRCPECGTEVPAP